MAFTVRAGAYAAGTTSVLIAVPTAGNAPVTGDAMYIVLETMNGPSNNAGTPDTPSGWSKPFERTEGAGVAGATTLTVFSKIAGASEADVTVSNATLNHASGAMVVITGHGMSAITDTVTGSGTASATSPLAIASITVTAGSLILGICGSTRDANFTVQFSSWTATDPSSLTEILDNGTTTGSGGGIGVAHGVCAGTTTGAGSVTLATNENHQTVFLGIMPPTTGEVNFMGQIPVGF